MTNTKYQEIYDSHTQTTLTRMQNRNIIMSLLKEIRNHISMIQGSAMYMAVNNVPVWQDSMRQNETDRIKDRINNILFEERKIL